ncbi:MAG: thiamine pyrophosphate-binding protein [Desulfobacter postgatei]|uniref:Thiamine pyrophosphate-binding protein n=1 Tax=Desulfobacter postgatei TaxID=2293 RepID=A0A2G6MRS1_9BACT|nr:MAG: thiamine pyrophosphate-binding protein [Desulfobacter postgatei]
MKVSDYLFSFLAERGIRTVFYLPGGGCMHLVDSLGRHGNNINSVSLLHEQAVSIAAESYANTSGNPGCALVTTGPGATNSVTGVLAAYLDSSPVFFVSGQVKTSDLKSRFGVRAHGSQEADIVSIVKPVTKYAAMVTDKAQIRYELERAWHEMTNGRKGPVWVDIPLDVQGAQIEPDNLCGFTPQPDKYPIQVSEIIESLKTAKRPVIIAGNGLNASRNLFYELLGYLQLPVIPTWKAIDYIPNDHPLYAGRAGGMGDRHGNFTMQNADLLLCLGARLDFSITGYDRSEWAVKAKKFIIEIDSTEILKLEGTDNIFPVIADVNDVLTELLSRVNEIHLPDLTDWKAQITKWKRTYPIFTSKKALTTYAFVQTLSEHLQEGAYVAPCSSGTTAEIFFQTFQVKQKQVVRSNHGLGSMGFEIPNAIGMCIASEGKEVICIAGDGGMQLNIQELAVIAGRKLPIKIFVINNSGYASIRNMQKNHFKGNYFGCDECSGLYLPALEKLSTAYNINYEQIRRIDDLGDIVKRVLDDQGATLCEVCVVGDCLVSPRTATQVFPDGSMRSSRLENQYPFLNDKEVKENMLL